MVVVMQVSKTPYSQSLKGQYQKSAGLLISPILIMMMHSHFSLQWQKNTQTLIFSCWHKNKKDIRKTETKQILTKWVSIIPEEQSLSIGLFIWSNLQNKWIYPPETVEQLMLWAWNNWKADILQSDNACFIKGRSLCVYMQLAFSKLSPTDPS